MTVDLATLREGDELPTLEVTPDLATAVRYCAVIWIFPGYFFDDDYARAAGMPGTIVPGPVRVGYLYRAIQEWLGDAGVVRQVRAAHRRPDATNHRIVVAGRVARLYEEDGARRADLEMAIVNEQGEPSVRGFAVVQFR